MNTSQVAENGKTAKPTNKSATAKLTMKKLVTLRNLWEQNTAAITKQLPTITKTFINARQASDTKFPGSVHFTESMSVQLLISRYYVRINDLFLPPATATAKNETEIKGANLKDIFISICSERRADRHRKSGWQLATIKATTNKKLGSAQTR